MKYKLKLSIGGVIYLLTPILLSILFTFLINRVYWNLHVALFIFLTYTSIMSLYMLSFCLMVENETLKIKIFGVSFQTIKFKDIEKVLITEDGIGLTALSKYKVKLILNNSNGRGLLFSIRKLDGFIDLLNNNGIEIMYANNERQDRSDKIDNRLNYIYGMLIMVITANITSLFYWDILCEIFNSILLVVIMITINIILATVILIILKKRKGS